MGRLYTVEFANVVVAASQDLLAMYAGNKAFRLKAFNMGQITATGVAYSQFSVRRLAATVTTGSGGTVVTPIPLLPGSAAAVVTSRANDTTKATTSGTNLILHTDVINWINGYAYQWSDADAPGYDINQACTITLDTASTSGSITVNMTATFEEMV